jgi:hypothetical protein
MRQKVVILTLLLTLGIWSCTSTKHLEKTSIEETRHVESDSTVKKTETKQETIIKKDSTGRKIKEHIKNIYAPPAPGDSTKKPVLLSQEIDREIWEQSTSETKAETKTHKADSATIHRDDNSKKKTEGKKINKKSEPFKFPWCSSIIIAVIVLILLFWKKLKLLPKLFN